MKLERMLSIITYLMNHDKAKAKDLAQRFEVSVRTIYRDVDAIAQAGIPVTTYQGADGGIGIVEGYRLEKNILTGDEVSSIVTALKGLHSIGGDIKLTTLIEKMSGIAGRSGYLQSGNEILIDLSPWNNNDRLGERIKEIKTAIKERRHISFTYFSYSNRTERRVEPLVIVYKASNWYLYAFCLLRKDFRLFKLRRMQNVNVLDAEFTEREFSLDRVQWDEGPGAGAVPVIVLFDKSMDFALADIFGMDTRHETAADGRLRVAFNAPVTPWLYGFILGFGDRAEVLEPAGLRSGVRSMAEDICRIYADT